VARARRAIPRRPRALDFVIVIVALLVVGAVAVLLLWPGSLTATIRRDTAPSAATESSPHLTPDATASPSASASQSDTRKPAASPASQAVVQAMNSCRNRVRAADEVIRQARTGVQHWDAHVDAERRAAEGDITVAERQRIFKETRLQGPGDQKRYADALRGYDKVKDASCGKSKGADAKTAATLARCQQRANAQSPVMRTGAAAMGDWKQHLADMQRSRKVHVADAQQVWLEAYKAAPPNINAFDKAVREFKAPKC
jgi:hypothetical protein